MAPLIRAVAALAAATLFTQVTATNVELPPCLDPFKPFAYSGCFAEKGTQGEDALDYRSSADQHTMTTAKCISECKGNGYRYAGLTFYGVCYCSATVNSALLDESACGFKCEAAQNETCGGSGAFSVWADPTFPNVAKVDVNAFKSIGCYTDDTNHGRTIGERQNQVDGSKMTPSSCIAACAADGYPFAGLEFGSECYCGVVIGNYSTPTTSDKCGMPCNGDSNKKCGGAGTVEVYASKELLSLEPCGFLPPVVSPSISIPISIPVTLPVTSLLPPPPTNTPKPTPSTTAPAMCTTTVVTPATCEYGCGKWCNKNLPDFEDQDGCSKASNRCALQVNACFKGAGFPGSASCHEFKAWCKDVSSYCSNSCSGKKGSCSKRDCYQKKQPKGWKPGSTSVSTYPCPTTATTPTTPVTVVPPPPTGICKQPSSWLFNYGPGNPVGGIEIPVVTCNDILEDFKAGNQFKLYTESDSRSCKGFGKGSLSGACNEACQEQYTECQNVYAQGCKAYNNRRRGAAYSEAPDIAKRFFFGDTFTVALNKCKIQLQDCIWENRNVLANNKCGVFGGQY
ncbi:wsc domain-containing protein [Colletotrichum truncatum]|uniref:Wsc domain-containing protein n=1 Tax=Colletotrichum truncatum TaxID=5467 RepID=A0ACC3YIQ5_COLTU|nr:wsc domain-containing protein [Colletotrichum truncatum]KAF6794389.1 wsc domain-containing protein [Colletotrichum truncatum]